MRRLLTISFLLWSLLASAQLFVAPDQWKAEYKATPSNYAAIRASIISEIFGTFPSGASPSTAAVVSGSIHGLAISAIRNYSSITRLTFTRAGTSHKIYRIVSATLSSGKAIFYLMGHSPINDVLAIQNYINDGHDVFFGAMPDSGDPEDLSDNTVSVTWTPVSGGNHNEMSALGVVGLSYFLYDKIECMNYIKASLSYEHVYVTGISGGGWTTLLLAAIDERFEKAFPVRGYLPRWYKSPPGAFLWDFEQGGGNISSTNVGEPVFTFFTNYPYETLMQLAVTNGRLLHEITHIDDSATLGTIAHQHYESFMESQATTMGGEYRLFCNTESSEAVHTNYQSEINVVRSEISDLIYTMVIDPDKTDELIGLGGVGTWDATSIFGFTQYHNGATWLGLYGGTDDTNASDPIGYSVGVFTMASANSGTKVADPVIDVDDYPAWDSIFPMDIWVDGTTIYLICTVRLDGGITHDTVLFTASTATPTDFTFIDGILEAGGVGHFNHGAAFFEVSSDPTNLYISYSHRNVTADPLRINIARAAKANLTSWTVIHTDIIQSYPSGVGQVYPFIVEDNGEFFMLYGRFNTALGVNNFAISSTRSSTLSSFPNGLENFSPTGSGGFYSGYTSLPKMYDDRFYFAGREGTGESSYIGIGTGLISLN